MLRGDRDRQALRQRRYDVLQYFIELVRKLDVSSIRSNEYGTAVCLQRDQRPCAAWSPGRTVSLSQGCAHVPAILPERCPLRVDHGCYQRPRSS